MTMPTTPQLNLDFGGPITVSELTRRIKDAVESGFPDVWLVGEITNLRIPSSGHIYLTLKDKDAQIRAVFFRSGSRFLKFRPEDGLEVIVRGRVSVYESRGEYQLIVEYMEPKGVGALQMAFIQLKAKLEKEGLFDPARKRPLPRYPQSVGVVTSPTGAAVRDILKVLRRRAPGVRVVIAPASVQGDMAPAEIAEALNNLNEYGKVDVIICGRGGGSVEDLAAFNSEVVARAISASNIPVISAVGHEVDFTIADFVADLRAPTPSAAAEVVAMSEEALRESFAALAGRLNRSVAAELRLRRARVDSETRGLGDPRRGLQDLLMRVDDLHGRLASGAVRSLASRRDKASSLMRALSGRSPAREITSMRQGVSGLSRRLDLAGRGNVRGGRDKAERLFARLASLEPLAPLVRGFAVLRRLPSLEPLTDASSVAIGDLLRVQLKKGGLDARVEAIYTEDQ